MINWCELQGKPWTQDSAASYGELTQPLVRRSLCGGGLKKPAFLLFVFVLLALKGLSQSTILDGVYLQSDEEMIVRIENIKKTLDENLSSFKEIEKADSAGYRYAYFDGQELKIVKSFYKEKELYKKLIA